ncbi:poly-beta-1,6-N-acetyl-D-glucosamine biosynthesis protein PgaD [Cognatilysobacter segetis]|uniref:poly-beta-1,6-N-acetyl-D-glucosamine biosynthesis protein PgaD n=1 Tax=Cognatilysobacter segetis TaxID=2492394 RepID=UPI00105DA1B1|nr:poly-beta-1,6-N-acetyl-D-glucosamine biosynthesis protein PgaD [Lysobacter segetis]
MSAPNPTDHPYIYTPQDRPAGATRTVHGVLTLIAWGLYAYLWLPLLTVLAWVLGIRTSFIELYMRNNRVDNQIFLVIGVLALVATLLLVGWAEWNRHKYGGQDRRAAPRHVDANDVAESLFAPIDVSQRLTRAKSATLQMGDDSRLIGLHRETPMRGQL